MEKSRGKGKAERGSSKRRGGRTSDAVGGDETHKRPWQQESSDSSGNFDLFDWAQPYKSSTTVQTCDRGRGGKTAASEGIRVGTGDTVGGDETHKGHRQQEVSDRSGNFDLFDWAQPYKTLKPGRSCGRRR